MATKMKNLQIVEALKLLGVIPPQQEVDSTGAQSSTFAVRLSDVYNVSDEDVARAKALTTNLLDRGVWDQDLIDEVLKTTEAGVSAWDQFNKMARTKYTPKKKYPGRVDTGMRGPSLENFNGALEGFKTADIKPQAPTPDLAVGPASIQSPKRGGVTPGKKPDPAAVPQGIPVKPPGGDTPKADAGLPKPADTRPAWQREGRQPTPQEIDEHVRQHFGADAWFMDIPEIHKILTDMAKEGNTDGAEATRRVTATQWYRNTNDTARAFYGRERSEPASVLSDIAEQVEYLDSIASGMDLEITPERLHALAEASLRFGWSPLQIKKTLGMEFKYDPKAEEQGATVSGLKVNAAKYLVPLSESVIEGWAKGILSGERTDEDFQAYLQSTAKSMFPHLQAAIDAGHTVEEYVDPYKQLAAKYLEIPVESINFAEPQWRAALEQRDPKTGVVGAMTLSEWTSKIKTDSTYKYDETGQGIDEASKLATDILKKFGKIG